MTEVKKEAKEEAKELVLSFYIYVATQVGEIPMEWNKAKKCALICVDEILNAVATIADKKYDFYTEVKKEIEKL